MTERDQFEGWWEPVPASPSPKLHGKIEWEPSPDGGTEVDLLVSRLDLADGEELEVTCDDHVVMRARVQGGSVRHVIRSADGHEVPALAGKTVALRHRGTTLAHAVLEPD